MIIKKYILLICIGILFLNCSKDDDSNDDFLVLYNQTYCLDPWGYAENDKDLATKIIDYFKEVNIQISNLKIDTKGTPQLCNACNCLSGKRIIAKVSSNDLDAINAYGFRELD